MDVDVRRAVTEGLRLLRSGGDNRAGGRCARVEDADLLDRANALRRVLFTQDDDLLREAKRRQQSGETFAGVIYAHQMEITIGQCISDLELIAKASHPQEWINNTAYLPL